MWWACCLPATRRDMRTWGCSHFSGSDCCSCFRHIPSMPARPVERLLNVHLGHCVVVPRAIASPYLMADLVPVPLRNWRAPCLTSNQACTCVGLCWSSMVGHWGRRWLDKNKLPACRLATASHRVCSINLDMSPLGLSMLPTLPQKLFASVTPFLGHV